MFYLDQKSEADLVAKLENGSIAEISTGSTPSSLQCSACGYDFLASADNRRRLWAGKDYTPLCSEGHQWGVGGNHLKLAGLRGLNLFTSNITMISLMNSVKLLS